MSSQLAAKRAQKAFLLSDHKHGEIQHGDHESAEEEEDSDGLDEVERIADAPFLAALQVIVLCLQNKLEYFYDIYPFAVASLLFVDIVECFYTLNFVFYIMLNSIKESNVHK